MTNEQEKELRELFNNNWNGYLDATKSIKVISESTFLKLIPQIQQILSSDSVRESDLLIAESLAQEITQEFIYEKNI